MPVIVKRKNKDLKVWPKKKFYILDLELTAWENSVFTNWNSKDTWREIIEIALLYVTLNKECFIIKDTFHYYVKPKINYKLSNYIQNLTGINQHKIENNGITFIEMFNKLNVFLKNPGQILFNGLDGQIIYENCLLNNLKKPKWYNRCRNFRTILSNNTQKPEKELFSSNLLNLVGLKNNLKGHSALNDCKIILKSINHLKMMKILTDI